MASDIASHIVGIMQQQQAAEVACLEANTRRTIALRAALVVFDDEEEDGQAALEHEVEATVHLHQAMPSAGGEPTWVLEYAGARMPASAPHASEFIVDCAVEHIKLSLIDALREHDLLDVVVDNQLELRATLALGGQGWCVFAESQSFEDTQPSTWAPTSTEYLASKGKQLAEVARHVVSNRCDG